MFVHFTIYNVKHNLPKTHKYNIENDCFPVFMGFQNANENVFHGLEVW